jgi:hypothetical protein
LTKISFNDFGQTSFQKTTPSTAATSLAFVLPKRQDL